MLPSAHKNESQCSFDQVIRIKGSPKLPAMQSSLKINPQLKNNLSKQQRTKISSPKGPSPLPPTPQDPQQVLHQIQEENRRLQQQVTQNGHIITSLIETLQNQDLDEDMIHKLKQAQDQLEPKKVFKKTFRVKNTQSPKEEEAHVQRRIQAPQTVGTNRPVFKLNKPRILKTSNFNSKSDHSHSGNNLFSSFKDINKFTVLHEPPHSSKFFDDTPSTPQLGQPSTLRPLISQFSQVNKVQKTKHLLPDIKKEKRRVQTEQDMDSLGNMTFQKSMRHIKPMVFDFPHVRHMRSDFDAPQDREGSVKSEKSLRPLKNNISQLRNLKNKARPKAYLATEITFEQFKEKKEYSKKEFPKEVFAPKH